jgi:hypothetical protein
MLMHSSSVSGEISEVGRVVSACDMAIGICLGFDEELAYMNGLISEGTEMPAALEPDHNRFV